LVASSNAESQGIYVYPREKRDETDECDGEERAARWELKKKRWDGWDWDCEKTRRRTKEMESRWT
jgi:hypothetical protein